MISDADWTARLRVNLGENWRLGTYKKNGSPVRRESSFLLQRAGGKKRPVERRRCGPWMVN